LIILYLGQSTFRKLNFRRIIYEETKMAYTYYANIHGPEAMRMGMCIGYGLKNAARDKSEKV
jgi:hypothetical protein